MSAYQQMVVSYHKMCSVRKGGNNQTIGRKILDAKLTPGGARKNLRAFQNKSARILGSEMRAFSGRWIEAMDGLQSHAEIHAPRATELW
jgi:hypothetical protein